MLGLVKHFYLVILGWIMFELSTAQQVNCKCTNILLCLV